MRSPASRRGTVLLMVLVLVAAMSLVTTRLLDDTVFGIKRTLNLRLSGQADWYAIGAEQLAARAIQADWQIRPNVSAPNAIWRQRDALFPVAGGTIEARIVDGGNCFNLNSLVSGSDEDRRENTVAGAEFERLLSLLGLTRTQATALVAAATDWLDSDSIPLRGGAEDSFYAGRTPPYRAANALFTEKEELRAVSGFTERIYRTLEPFVCAHPTTEASTINVNTIRPQQAPVLAAIFEDLSLNDVNRALSRRPPSGYLDKATFFQTLGLADVATSSLGQRLDVQTYHYRLDSRIILGDLVREHSALMKLEFSGEVRILWRRFGSPA